MKPELLNILSRIGYHNACLYDHSLTFQFWEPVERGNRHFKDKQEAAECIQQLRKMTALLQEISPHLFNLINDQSKNTEDWNQSRDPLLDVASGVIDLTALAELENIRIWNGRGASRRVAGVDIAKHMAEVFVLGIGKMPGSGAKCLTSALMGPNSGI